MTVFRRKLFNEIAYEIERTVVMIAEAIAIGVALTMVVYFVWILMSFREPYGYFDTIHVVPVWHIGWLTHAQVTLGIFLFCLLLSFVHVESMGPLRRPRSKAKPR